MTWPAAVLSEDGLYRYRLHRAWDPLLPSLLWVMLNPSTADASIDDPTIRRVVRFSRDAGYGEAVVVNMFAYRSTRPEKLLDVDDPVGPENVQWLREELAVHDAAVLAWGSGIEKVCGTRRSYGPRWKSRPDVVRFARDEGVDLYRLGLTASGHPRHPLFVPASVTLDRVV